MQTRTYHTWLSWSGSNDPTRTAELYEPYLEDIVQGLYTYSQTSSTIRISQKDTSQYLAVLVGVPVGVEENARVRGAEVDSQAPGPRGQQEDEELGVAVELLDLALPVENFRRPIDAVEQPASAVRHAMPCHAM